MRVVRPTSIVALAAILALATLQTPALGADGAQRGRARGKQANGPAFCRSGQGHPVYGRLWCLEKGFGLGSGTPWVQVTLGEVVFQRLPHGPAIEVRLGAREIAGILTDMALDAIFDRLGNHPERERLEGRWRGGPEYGTFVLELAAGDEPLAELVDGDGDGVVDNVLLAAAIR